MGETCILLSGRTSVRRSYENHDAVYKMTKHECRMTKEWNNSCGESCSATFPVATGLWPVSGRARSHKKWTAHRAVAAEGIMPPSRFPCHRCIYRSALCCCTRRDDG